MLINDVTSPYVVVQLDEPSQQGIFLDSFVLGDINLHGFGSTRVRRLGNSSLCLQLSQQVELLRTLLVKEASFSGDKSSSFWINLATAECCSSLSSADTKADTACSPTVKHILLPHSIRFHYKIRRFHEWCESCHHHHLTSSCWMQRLQSLNGLQSATRYNGALVTCADTVQVLTLT